MSRSVLYQWENEIARHIVSANSWQQANMALFSYGIIEAEDCQQRAVARRLWQYGDRASLERRLQRFVANTALDLRAWWADWIAWVWQASSGDRDWTILVDESKLGKHLGCLVAGVAYAGRCIPLVWHVYRLGQYPRAGQVGLVVNLLMHIKQALPAEACPLVMADRGIGCSSRLVRAVTAMGWRYLFRVTKQSKIITEAGEYCIYQQVQAGEIWSQQGKVFKKRGQIPARAIARWDIGYDEPWALVTNDPRLDGAAYARRAWQEASFRDLKSGGWQWGQAHVWLPDHAAILLLLLSLAYGWVVALGTYAFHWAVTAAPRRFKSGLCKRTYSIFQEGLNLWSALKRRHQTVCLTLCFCFDKPPG